MIICGDYNVTLGELDYKDRVSNHVKCQKFVLDSIEQNGYCDLWRIRNPGVFQHSWVRRKPRCLARLDYMIVDYGLAQKCDSIEYEYSSFSDHYMLSARFMADGESRGPGLWKLNTLLLNNKQHVERIQNKIKGITRVYTECEECWEIIKNEVKKEFIEIGKEVASKQNVELDSFIDLSRRQGISEEIVHNDESTFTFLNEINCRIEEIELQIVQAAAFRSRAQWIRDGERNSKYFFALEKRNYNAKSIIKLICNADPGRESYVTQQALILKEMATFYAQLYTSDGSISFRLVNTSNCKLSPQQAQKLDEEINAEECYLAMKSMKYGKAPGCDGLSIEFYDIFWDLLAPVLVNLYQKCIDNGLLNRTARLGLISLILKKDKDPVYIRNWRPLTLLNMDYKILAKLLATRMKLVLDDIIGYQLTGFMEGRNISDNIRKTIDIVAHVNRAKMSALIVNIDYEKCFDRIEYCAVFGSLRYFGFGEKFIHMVSLFFNKFQFCTQNYGYTSDCAAKTRGVNQGCPISPYIFLVCSEVMAHKIKKNPLIRGFTLGNVEHIISQFADDTILFLSFEQISLENAVKVMQEIEFNTRQKSPMRRPRYTERVHVRVAMLDFILVKIWLGLMVTLKH